MGKTSQTKDILNHLLKGKSITPIEALRLYKCFRLAARVNDLRKMGYPVQTKIIRNVERRWARYWLDIVIYDTNLKKQNQIAAKRVKKS